MSRDGTRRQRGLFAGLLCLVGVFVADVTLPLGALAGVAYVIVVISAFFFSARDAFVLATVATLTNAVGYLLAPPIDLPAWVVATLRGATVFTTWMLIVTGIHFHKQSRAVIAAIRESNERRRTALEDAERVQRERLLELQTLTDAIPMLIGYVDSSQTFRFANAAHEDAYGVPPERVNGRAFRELVGDAMYRRIEPQVAAVLRGKRVQFEEQMIRGDGVYFYLFQFLPRIDESGAVIGFYTLVTDITGFKRSQEKVDLQREALALSNRRGAANEMAAALAHEMNQPLSSIAIYAGRLIELQREGKLKADDILPALAFMREEALRAGEVVKRARLMVEDKPLQPTRIDAAELLDSVKKICGTKAATEGVAVEIELPTAAPTVYADRVQLQQVLVNLVSNAIDASTGQSRERRRVVIGFDSDDTGVHFTVIDFGSGFASGEGDRVFQPHYTTKPDGLGIGLTIARSIVGMHEGRLWAETNTDCGVTFHVTLPPPPTDLLDRTADELPLIKETR
ncbi:MAG: PAS domain-containing protein [Lacipirellulaceae bacterium]